MMGKGSARASAVQTAAHTRLKRIKVPVKRSPRTKTQPVEWMMNLAVLSDAV